METKSQIGFINFYDLFTGDFFADDKGHHLSVPLYQRGYKWAMKERGEKVADSSVEYFVKDLLDHLNDDEFFLQGITVNDERTSDGVRIIELIDGQQRVTSMYLLLWYLTPPTGSHVNSISREGK